MATKAAVRVGNFVKFAGIPIFLVFGLYIFAENPQECPVSLPEPNGNAVESKKKILGELGSILELPDSCTLLFSVSGTVIIWCRWLLKDAKTRAAYRNSVAEATEKILKRIKDGSLTPAEGAIEAHAMRNEYLIQMRNRTLPLGLLVARFLKPVGREYDYYLNKNARKRFGKDFKDLSMEEARRVLVLTTRRAGHANTKVSASLQLTIFAFIGMIVVAVTVSTYSVVVGPDWGNVMVRYAAVGYGAMAGGELGVAVGALGGGVLSVVLGSIVGSALGHFGVDYLANSLLGKVPGKRVEELLCSANEQTSRWVKNKMMEAKREYVSMGTGNSAPCPSSQHIAVEKIVDKSLAIE